MAEVRLIDANALIDAIPVVKDMDEEITVGGAVSDFICMISAQPTIDAVPVVRCKDCIGKAHWYKNDYGITICGLSGLFVVEDKDFCSYGERMEDNAAD